LNGAIQFVLLGALDDAAHHLHCLARIKTCRRFRGEHHRVDAIVNRRCHVGRFGASRRQRKCFAEIRERSPATSFTDVPASKAPSSENLVGFRVQLSQTCRRDRTPADLNSDRRLEVIRVSNFIQTAVGNGHTLSNYGDVDSRRLVSHERVSCQRLIQFRQYAEENLR
jgi:hypothetical protein